MIFYNFIFVCRLCLLINFIFLFIYQHFFLYCLIRNHKFSILRFFLFSFLLFSLFKPLLWTIRPFFFLIFNHGATYYTLCHLFYANKRGYTEKSSFFRDLIIKLFSNIIVLRFKVFRFFKNDVIKKI